MVEDRGGGIAPAIQARALSRRRMETRAATGRQPGAWPGHCERNLQRCCSTPASASPVQCMMPAAPPLASHIPVRAKNHLMNGQATILVVDDEVQIQRFLRHALEAAGYAIIIAASGAQALQMARQHRIDAIVLDLGTARSRRQAGAGPVAADSRYSRYRPVGARRRS